MYNLTNSSISTSKSLLNPFVLSFFLVFNLLLCSELIGILGIVANIINIRIFYKQGFKDSVNVTLTALAISDLGALVTAQLFNIMVNPWFLKAEVPFVPEEIVRAFSFYPHGYFIRVSGIVTAFAALERCLCVVLPLKVKLMITARVSAVVNVAIFLILLLSLVPFWYTTYIDWRSLPGSNRTVLGIALHSFAPEVYSVSYLVTDFLIPNFTFFLLISCNVLITLRIRTKSSWRSGVSSGGSLSPREKKMLVMLSVVSGIFVVCLLPQSATLTAITIVPELKVNGAYFDVSLLCYSFSFLAESINSSAPLIVYYMMSSKHRESVLTLLGLRLNKTKPKERSLLQ